MKLVKPTKKKAPPKHVDENKSVNAHNRILLAYLGKERAEAYLKHKEYYDNRNRDISKMQPGRGKVKAFFQLMLEMFQLPDANGLTLGQETLMRVVMENPDKALRFLETGASIESREELAKQNQKTTQVFAPVIITTPQKDSEPNPIRDLSDIVEGSLVSSSNDKDKTLGGLLQHAKGVIDGKVES